MAKKNFLNGKGLIDGYREEYSPSYGKNYEGTFTKNLKIPLLPHQLVAYVGEPTSKSSKNVVNEKKGILNGYTSTEKLGLGLNTLATVGSMVAAGIGMHKANTLKRPDKVAFTAVVPERIPDNSGTRSAQAKAEVDNQIASMARLNEGYGRLPDSGRISALSLDAQRKNGAQIEAERQQIAQANAQLKAHADTTNAQASLQASAQNAQNSLQHQGFRTQLASQNLQTLIEAPLNMGQSLIALQNIKQSRDREADLYSLNSLAHMYASIPDSDTIGRMKLQEKIGALMEQMYSR